MKIIKTHELTGATLDWAVAKCEGCPEYLLHDFIDGVWSCANYKRYSMSWSQSGPIIEREKIELNPWWETRCDHRWVDEEKTKTERYFSCWSAFNTTTGGKWFYHEDLLVAAMRCYVASKLGDAVDVPEELL